MYRHCSEFINRFPNNTTQFTNTVWCELWSDRWNATSLAVECLVHNNNNVGDNPPQAKVTGVSATRFVCYLSSRTVVKLYIVINISVLGTDWLISGLWDLATWWGFLVRYINQSFDFGISFVGSSTKFIDFGHQTFV